MPRPTSGGFTCTSTSVDLRGSSTVRRLRRCLLLSVLLWVIGSGSAWAATPTNVPCFALTPWPVVTGVSTQVKVNCANSSPAVTWHYTAGGPWVDKTAAATSDSFTSPGVGQYWACVVWDYTPTATLCQPMIVHPAAGDPVSQATPVPVNVQNTPTVAVSGTVLVGVQGTPIVGLTPTPLAVTFVGATPGDGSAAGQTATAVDDMRSEVLTGFALVIFLGSAGMVMRWWKG